MSAGTFTLSEIELVCGVTRTEAEAARNDSYIERADLDRMGDRMGKPLKVVVPAGYGAAVAQAGARLATGMPVTYLGRNRYGHHVYQVET